MIICVVGPTAVGKTKLSIALAKIYNGEVINADSVQVYKGLNIGSAKVTEEEKEGIVHHLLDIVDVKDDYTIYHYQKDCRKAILKVKSAGKVPILVGGSGLYLKSALYNYNLSEENTKDIEYDLSNEELYEKVKDKFPNIDKNNRRRLLRAYNKIQKNISLENEELKPIYDDIIWIGLETNRETLYQKINERVDKMFPNLIDEVYEFYEQKINSKAIKTAIGYKELYDYFNKTKTLEESISLIKQNSRHYAKRQYTFFKHQLPVNWITTDYNDFSKTINKAIKIIENNK